MKSLIGVFVAVLLVTLAGLAMVSCGGNDGRPAEPTADDSAGVSSPYPVTVVDHLGRAVTISARPERIVALSPTAAELVYAVEREVVGRASSVEFPDAALAATEVGTAYQPNIDVILSLKPDLVIADDVVQSQPELRRALEGLPVPVLFAGVESYEDVLYGIRLVGSALDEGERARAEVDRVESARKHARSRLEGLDVSALVLIGDRDHSLYGAKDSSYIGDVLTELGISNPASVQPDSGPFPGYTSVAPEKLLEYDPDFIFTITPAPPPAPRLSEQVPAIPPFRGLTAVTERHVIEAPVDTFLKAPGPRVVDVFEVILSAVADAQGRAQAGGSGSR